MERSNRNNDKDRNGLKRADAQKVQVDSHQPTSLTSDLFKGKKIKEGTVISKSKIKKQKKFPLVMDILLGIIMVALVVGLIFVSYVLFKYYSNDYNGVDIKYTVTCFVDADLSEYAQMKDGEVYADIGGKTTCFGRVKRIYMVNGETGEEKNCLVLDIEVNALYMKEKGYSVSGNRIAVGKEYSLRSAANGMTLNVAIVEIEKVTGGR